MTNPPTFTARQIARALCAHSQTRITRQGVAHLMKDVGLDSVRVERGRQETPAWKFASLVEPLKARLETAARLLGYRNGESLLEIAASRPALLHRLPVPLADICEDELARAARKRSVFAPVFSQSKLSASDRDALIVQRYRDEFGRIISPDYARKIFRRIVDLDCGLNDFGRLELYLPDDPKRKQSPEWTMQQSAVADALPLLDSRLADLHNVTHPPKRIVKSVWRTACAEYLRLVADGAEKDHAARVIRRFLHDRAPFLPRNRDTLLKAWNQHLTRFLNKEGKPGAFADGRRENGKRASFEESDIARLRHSAATMHSGRLDSAWREEYGMLSAKLRDRYPKSYRCPRAIADAVNRVILDGLTARHKGKRYLERMLGTILRDLSKVPTHHAWVMDDLTCNLEVSDRNPDGSLYLGQPQVIGVLDVASRKFVGWAISLDKGPTALLVTRAFRDSVKRTERVPHNLCLENGWVFGRSTHVIGKRNECDDLIVAGLGEFGCEIHHFIPCNPTSKGELEKAFDLLQQRMERHPGYTGRLQMLSAPQQFRREQLEMNRSLNPRDPATCRYTFAESVRVIGRIIEDYNATPKQGALRGQSPNDAYQAFADAENPPIMVTPEMLALLFPEKQRVTITNSGVRFKHYGELIRVRGGQLASLDRLGREYWACVDESADCVTFMSIDYRDVFTEPLRPLVPYDISEHAPESDALRIEAATKADQRRVIDDQYQGLLDRFGNPREELLHAAQAESRLLAEAAGAGAGRLPVVDPEYAAACAQGQQQRQELRQRSKSQKRRDNSATPNARPGYDEARASIFGSAKEIAK